MSGRVVDWYRLPKSGQPFHGPVPPGAEVIDAPTQPSPESDVEILDKPGQGDTKSDWVAYAVQEGLDVDGLTKTEIVAEVEALEERIDAIENGESVPVPVADLELGTDTQEPGPVPGHQDQRT